MKFKYLTFIIMAFLLVGCSIMEDQDNPCPNPEESEFINLTFNMVVPSTPKTRTDNAGHEEINSEWPEFEDHIYTDDLAIYLFAVLSEDNQPFLAKIDDFSLLTNPNSSITGGPETYTINVALPKTNFEKAVPTESDKVTLKVAVFANTNKKFSNLTVTDYASFNALIKKASEWDFNIFGSIYAGTGTVDGNLKSGARIPMYGTTTLEATRDQVYKSRPENPLWGGEISMLRSVAKIQVVDNITNRDISTGLPRIESVAFFGQDKAYILPNNAINYNNGQQVETPNICTGNQKELGLLKKEANKWIGYVPEQYTKDSKFEINVTYELKEDGTPLVQKTFSVPLTEYNGQTFEFGTNILRNHIYTLSVNEVKGAEAEVTFIVKEWEVNTLYLNYTQTVVVNPALVWDDLTYESFDTSTGAIEVKTWSHDPKPVIGTFTLQEPVGATWTAYLLPKDGSPDAFSFCEYDEVSDSYYLWEDSQTTSLSGVINGEEIKLAVCSSMESTTEENSAILQVLVRMDNGTILEVPLVAKNSPFSRYTFVQKPL